MTTWVYSLVAVVAISGVSLIGAVTLVLRPGALSRSLPTLIAFAAGALLGDAFLHIIPELAESEAGLDLFASFALIGGIVLFFILEKILHWHHAHVPTEDPRLLHPVAATNLLGDALHNFIDGGIVAGAFLLSPGLGLATALAVALHEIPQELGDFGILIHAGLQPRRALGLNLLVALTAVAGAVVTLVVASEAAGFDRVLLPLTAGGFIYIASTDLFPELHKEPHPIRSAVQLTGVLAGVAVMALLLVLD
ncbi:MAG: ZIP family metal transporter [Chloroflexota bacterium]|nr:ZIP family metal transporter [Chloroflexota bacterium]